ncbi:uncharacterized protein C8Q71DRAFT_727014 [Rhodofomes roseus]|uniref:Uncharacterized protein n=1 Tax=Rhodofomes roseus TaxID=34475 RepID=A0ABQ8K2X7_9APHY|nr:uncharacterized protein C8Q71DRAFT_727014 [Rhodofomes roseus]KAH9831187.1 hypothetical protein C8Q71DRAFT_727014 [Rhodofomes roseus]
MSAESMTAQRHNDYVGGDASRGRIPGADKASTGHQYEAIFPKSGPPGPNGTAHANPPQEHLPPSTGRDAPPAAGVPPVGPHITQVIPGDQLSTGHPAPPVGRGPAHTDEVHHTDPAVHRIQTARTTGQPVELAPAPDSNTVVDRDPYAQPTSAGDTLTGATSKDVHAHLGHPGSGQTSSELHHDGQHGRKHAPRGADQFGSGAIPREIGPDAEAEQPGELYKSGTQERRVR